MKTGKDIILEYCKTIETHDPDYLRDAIDNGKDIENGRYIQEGHEFAGCPTSYGLDEWEGLCENEKVEGWPAQREQCKKCWTMALNSVIEQ